jgi:ribosome-associated protein
MEYKSKTEKKREATYLQEIGVKLTRLSVDQLDRIEMPQEMRDAVDHAKSITNHGGLRRQLQYIGTIMRNIDHSLIEETVHDIENAQLREVMLFKEIEVWRDRLIGGNDSLLEEILAKHPETDRQQLTQLIRNAKKEAEAGKPPKAFRVLFKYLKKIRLG